MVGGSIPLLLPRLRFFAPRQRLGIGCRIRGSRQLYPPYLPEPMAELTLQDVLRELRADIRQVGQEIKEELRQEINDFKVEVRQEISDFKAEVRQEIDALKADFASIRADVDQLKVDVAALKVDVDNLKGQVQDLAKNSAWHKNGRIGRGMWLNGEGVSVQVWQ